MSELIRSSPGPFGGTAGPSVTEAEVMDLGVETKGSVWEDRATEGTVLEEAVELPTKVEEAAVRIEGATELATSVEEAAVP